MKMMRSAAVVLVGAALMQGTAWAQNMAEVTASIQAIDQQIEAAHRTGAEQGVPQQVRDAASSAGEAINKAISEIAGVKQVDDQVEALMNQVRELHRQRDAIVKAHEEDIAPLRAAAESAGAAMRLAVTGGVDVRPLLDEKARLVRLQAALREVERASASLVE